MLTVTQLFLLFDINMVLFTCFSVHTKLWILKLELWFYYTNLDGVRSGIIKPFLSINQAIERKTYSMQQL